MKNDKSTEAASPLKRVIHFKDISFTVVIEPYDYSVKYTIYDIKGYSVDDQPLWHKKDSPKSPDPVSFIKDADIYLHGHVKWDGCSDWHFDEQDRLMLHGCSMHDIERFGFVMKRCWKMTRHNCPHWAE